MSSSVHVYSNGKYILILGEGDDEPLKYHSSHQNNRSQPME